MLNLKPCKPAEDVDGQLRKIGEEVGELVTALEAFKKANTGKYKAEVLFEALDVIVAVLTLITMLFSSAEIDAGIKYTNSKNFVRGYLNGDAWQAETPEAEGSKESEI
jgi:NTP pyrophosphatase (non-canonical NTP hydrolase)